MFDFPYRKTPAEAPFLLAIFFEVLIAQAEAQLKLRVVRAFPKLSLCCRDHVPVSHSHLVGFETPANGKHAK